MADTKRILLACALLAASSTLAGQAANAEGLKLFAAPGEDTSAVVARPLPLLQPLPGEVRTGGKMLVPFEQAAAAMRLSGEDASTVLTFSLNGAQSAAGGDLQLAYRNAVSVLPENATLDVEVNGRAVGSFAVRSPNGFVRETVPVAAEFLLDGRNEARLRVRQYHRVDCSLEATYELWTELDPALSGFEAQSNGGFRNLPDLLAVGRGERGVTDIRLVMPEKTGVPAANDSLALIQTLALYLNRPDIVVSTGVTPGQGPGIDVYVGHHGNLRGADQLSGLSVHDTGVAGRAALVLAGVGRSEVQAQLVAAVSGPMRAGFDSGVRANSHGRIVAEPSGRYTLKDAGYRTQPFSGRMARSHFEIEMPADFYPAEYGAVDFYLKGATAPGLQPGAQLLVLVNGKSVRSYPFRDQKGEEFQGKRLELPLRAFHPGVNRVEIAAELPMATDAACAPQARDENRPRFILLDESELRVPELARIGRLPDLAAFSGAAYPFANGKPFDIFLDNSDASTLGAAMTVMSRLSLSARQPLGGEIIVAQAQEGRNRDALVLSSGLVTADAEPVKGARLASHGVFDPLTTASVGALAAPAALAGGVADSRSLLEAFHTSTAVEHGSLSPMEKVSEWAARAGGRFGQWLQYKDTGALDAGQDGALITLSQMRSPLGSATWTVIKASTPADLEKGVARLTETSIWRSLEGGMATIRADDMALATHAPKDRYVYELSDTGFFNLRRIVAAWFSDNFQFYIVSLIALMTALALWLGRIVPRMGVRTDDQ